MDLTANRCCLCDQESCTRANPLEVAYIPCEEEKKKHMTAVALIM